MFSGGSEILNPLITGFLGGAEILNPVFLWGIRNSESFHYCVLGESEILNPLLCSWGIRNPEFSPVFIGGSEVLNLHFSMGEPLEKRNSKDHLGSNAWLRHSNEV